MNQASTDRRSSDTVLQALNKLQESFDVRHTENVDHLATLEAKVDRVLRGFPADDPDAHRRYHESIIEWRELRNKLVREAMMKAVGASAIVACGWLAVAVWQAVKLSIKQ